MARQTHTPPFTGTHDLICVYKMKGKYYLRKPSSLTGERVKTDPHFRKTMKHADLLRKGSRIGSKVYATLPSHHKLHILYRKITGEAMQWLKHNWKEEDVIVFLLKKYSATSFCLPQTQEKEIIQTKPAAQSGGWQPLTNRRSIKAFVRNMIDGKRARKNREYDRFLAFESTS